VAVSDVGYPADGNTWCAAVEDDSWWFRHRNRCLLEIIRRFPPPTDTPFYDIGGGNGIVAAALTEVGIPAVVVEPGEDGARNARARGLTAKQATLETAGFAAGEIGAIGLFDVVEHVAHDVAFLTEARRYLRKGGRLYLTVPAYQALWSAEDVHAKHYRRYTRRSIRRALEAAGLKVEHASYMFAMLPLPILLFRSIPHRLGYAPPVTPNSMQRDHSARRGLSGAMLRGILELERVILRKAGGLPFGGSVVAVARA
jgi:SAM-dependent methyltransferase